MEEINENDRKKCPYCGTQNEDESIQCGNCGEILIDSKHKSWVITYLLIAFFGMLGVHNFYNKKMGVAVAQLILTLTIIGSFITAIWVFVDMIMLLFGSYRDANGQKLSKKPTKTSTALLSFAFVHRFYVEDYGFGVLFILTFGGLGIWWLIDLITIISGKFKNANGDYIIEV